MKSKLDPYKEDIIRLYNEEWLSYVQIAKLFNVGKTTVSNFLLANNGLERGKKKRGSKLDSYKEEIIELYNSGETYEALGEKFDLTVGSIANFINGLGIDKRKPLKKKSKLEPYKDDIIKMYVEDEFSLANIGIKYDVSGETVREFLISKKIKIRESGWNSKLKKPKLETHKDDVIKMYQNGSSCKEIGNLFEVGKTTVMKFLNSNGISTKQSTKKYLKPSYKLDPYKEDVIRLYNNGKSTYEISRMFSVHHNTVYNLLKREGVKLRERGGHNKRELPIDIIVELYKDGKSTIEIADMFNANHETIRKILKREKVELRKPRKKNS